jgi:hypothetical protein
MSTGKIGLSAIIEPGSTIEYKKTASDIGAVMGRFLRGPHLEFVLCTSEEDFKNKFGEEPLDGYEMDWWFVISFFRASEENGRLYVRNVYYYDSNPGDGVTAARADTSAAGLDSNSRVWFEAYSRGTWAHASEKNLQVVIRETTQRKSGSGRCDILVYYDGSLVKAYMDLSWDTNDTRNVRDVIPVDGDGWIIPHWDSTKSVPNYGTSTTYTFAGGNNGFSASGPDALAAKHWIGEKYSSGEFGNSGFYGLLPFLNNAELRPTFILNQLGNESYEYDHYVNLTNFCRTYWLTHFSSPGSGLSRDDVMSWKYGDGVSTFDRSTTYGEARVSWPWFYPRGATNKTLVIPPSAADAGRMVAQIYRSGGHVHEPYVGTDGDRGSLALVTSKLERSTGPDDRDALNPLGICVISSDLGGIYLDGSRTMATDNRFLEMSSRRHLAVVVISGILAQSRWLVHGLNDEGYENSPGIWRRGTMAGRQFMRKYAADGAFTSKEMGVGWMFKLGEPYTTSSDISERIARARIGFSPRSCAEQIIFSLGVEEGQLNAAPAPAE